MRLASTMGVVPSDVQIAARDATLPGILSVPDEPLGVVLFAHGSGSSRLSTRNRMVAERLVGTGFATLLFDLLDEQEAADRSAVFDIPFLAARLEDASLNVPALFDGWLPVGYFGASTGAAAALWAAAELGPRIGAVVSRGGRPDLAASHLGHVRAPTLLIVGGRDDVVLQLNREAQAKLRCTNDLDVVPGATHLFEEPGALERVADLAARWFLAHLGRAA
jgi:putative phosphoribosyl transferase